MDSAKDALSIVFLLLLSLPSSSSTANHHSLVVAPFAMLQLSHGLLMKHSPNWKAGTSMVCESVHIHGLSRVRNLRKFAHLIMVRVSGKDSSVLPTAEVCFHRNISLGIGMCPNSRWEKISNGSRAHSMSPFGYKLLDIQTTNSSLESFVVSIEEGNEKGNEASSNLSKDVTFNLFICCGLVLCHFSSITFLDFGIQYLRRLELTWKYPMLCINLTKLAKRKNTRSHIPDLSASEDSHDKYTNKIWSNEDSNFPAGHRPKISSMAPDIPSNHGFSGSSSNQLHISSFHTTPERRKFSKPDWEQFTRDSTQKALEDLVSSPGFGKWLSKNVDRISVTPPSSSRA